MTQISADDRLAFKTKIEPFMHKALQDSRVMAIDALLDEAEKNMPSMVVGYLYGARKAMLEFAAAELAR